MRVVRRAGRVEVGEAGLPAVRVGKPAEEVIEAPVLHHDDDDVLDAGALRMGQRCQAVILCARGRGEPARMGGKGGSGRARSCSEEVASLDRHLLLLLESASCSARSNNPRHGRCQGARQPQPLQ